MKLSGKVILIAAAVLAVAAGWYFLFPKNASSDQADVLKTLGTPDQFVISYLPRGERELVRTEVWLYPEAGKRVGFTEGRLAYAESYTPDATVAATRFSPSDFFYDQDWQEVADILGGTVEEGEFLPGLEDTRVYYSPDALYVTDGGFLTYFQTLGTGDKTYLTAWEEAENKKEAAPTAAPSPVASASATLTDWKTYTSSDIGMAVQYPPDWFLSGGVLASYDTGYMEKNLPLPEKRLKCDFHEYDSKILGFDNPQPFLDGAVKAVKGKAVDLSGETGPGLGDAVLFVISDSGGRQMALTCYSYHADFEETLKKVLSAFSFL